jgi:anti-sigma-D factor RsdA-like protein
MPDFGRWSDGGGDPSLNEINRADRFFEALASKQPVYSTDPAEAELAFLFAEFRDDVRDAPVTAPVSAGDAVEALRGGLATTRGSRRGFAIVGSVAAAMLCIGGFGTAVYGAGPGDSLYGMRTTIFGQQEQTRDDQVSLASAQLQQVQQLIDQGQWEQAQDKLVQVSSAVQGVDQVEDKQQLVEQWNALTYKVVEQDPAATLPPGQPLPVLPSSPLTWLPVPVVENPPSESTTSEATTSESTTSESTTTSVTSDTTTTTDPSSSAVPPETLMTAPSDSPTTSIGSSSASTAPPTSPVAVPPSTSVLPATSTVASPSSPSPTRATTTVTSTVPVEAPVATVPPSTPAVAPVAPTATEPASPPSASAPSSASVASPRPTASTASERPSVAPTTTVVP